MQTVRQILHHIANRLPERTVFVDATNALSIRQKLDQGWRDLDAGRTYTQKEVGLRLQCNRSLARKRRMASPCQTTPLFNASKGSYGTNR